jgi:hypothetical protein
MRRTDEPDGRRGAVLLVVGVQDQQPIQRPGERGVLLVRFRREAEGQAQEVLDIAEGVVGIQQRLSD